ncbi:hypothetical protein EV643_11781 [Kribbella sp. VKM Ac-2527]|uniref:Uncharacterized protein n=1 Tax=Kribbella caucasensis TaxID=2512215 RepID=A0A4V3C947_9ACTN|nr:hypothetical protein [Kribbella sp. VKM Ac-2527]TDO44058.1 hypothetical protein EV643_11781 [Kribbella sp. VKM Ac-2527]
MRRVARVLKLALSGLALGGLVAGVVALVYLEVFATRDYALSSGSLDKTCEEPGRTAFPAAPAYAGNGPHPIWIKDGSLTSKTKPMPAAWTPKPAEVQLIACEVGQTPGGYLGSCDFDWPEERTIRVTAMTYEFEVYEARTGRRIGKAPVQSISVLDCPSMAWIKMDDRPEILAPPGYQQFEAGLGEFVARPVG